MPLDSPFENYHWGNFEHTQLINPSEEFDISFACPTGILDDMSLSETFSPVSSQVQVSVFKDDELVGYPAQRVDFL